MAGHNNYSLSARPTGIGNIMGPLHQKVSPIRKLYLKESTHKSPHKGVSHALATLPVRSSKHLSPIVIKRKPTSRNKSPNKQGKSKRSPSKVIKTSKKLPDIF